MKHLLVLTNAVLLFLSVTQLAKAQWRTTKYVVAPTEDDPSLCSQNQQCLTLNNYVINQEEHFQSNTTFVFLQGTHQLDSNVRLVGVRNVSFQVAPGNEAMIALNPQATVNFIDCSEIEIDSLTFMTLSKIYSSYGIVFINTTNIHITNVSFIGSNEGTTGCDAIVFESSLVEISDSNFIGLQHALLLVSETQMSLLGINVFANNTGGAIYSANSYLTTSGGTNRFIKNHAAVIDSDQVNRYSNNNYSVHMSSTGLGGAIFGSNSSIVLYDSFTFIDNSAEVAGGAIALVNNSILIMTATSESVPLGDMNKGDVSFTASFIQNQMKLRQGADFQQDVAFLSRYGSGGAVYAENSRVNIFGTTFFNNSTPTSGGALHFNSSLVTLHNVTMLNNSAYIAGAIRVDVESELEISGNNFFESNSVLDRGGAIYVSNISTASFKGDNYFKLNAAGRGGSIFVLNASIHIEGLSVFEENAGRRGGAVYLNEANATFVGMHYFRRNTGGRGSAVFMFRSSLSFNRTNHFEDNSAGRGGALYISNSTVTLFGDAYFLSNSATSRGGALYLLLSTVVFTGPGENVFDNNYSGNFGGVAYMSTGNIILENENSTTTFRNNLADSIGGCIMSNDGYLQLTGDITFESNQADYGGALALYGTSRMRFNRQLWANFTNNLANFEGGAIYFVDSVASIRCINEVPIKCFFTIGSNSLFGISLTFTNNSAKMSGNSLYGGQLDRCRVYFSNLLDSSICQDRTLNMFSDNAIDILKSISTISISDISSPPVKICVCENESSLTCDTDEAKITIKPGQHFEFYLASFGQAQHFVNSTVLSKNIDINNSYRLSPTIQTTGKSCTKVSYRMFSSITNVKARHQLFFNGPCQSLRRGINLDVDILPCPVGFKLLGEACECDERLKEFTQSCFIDNNSIERTTNNFWVSQQVNSTGFVDGLVLHQNGCPFDYCTKSPVNMTLDNPDIQCSNNRSGLLCGACKENFSLALGSLHCLSCSNAYLALIIPFALAGIALVAVLSMLRLTVAAGTLNGLIFYANIVQANHQAFFPRETINFFTVFISWLNLDFGIETCFYSGMDIYVYSWLQFLFPFYVWLLIAIIITASHYSRSMAKVLGHNPVAVLATLFLMSYAKMLSAIIAPLTATSLSHTVPNESYSRVWLYDANIPYFRDPRHIVLGVFAILALLFLFLPYTLLLLCGHWLQMKSNWRLLSWINKLKPFMDAYHAPYKKQSRYWTGLLLLTRCGLFLTFAFNLVENNRVNFLAITSVCIALALLKERVYENHYNDYLESSFILNLCILSIATLFIADEGSGSQYVLSSISVGIAFSIFCGIVVFHVYLQLKKTALWGEMKDCAKNSSLGSVLFKDSELSTSVDQSTSKEVQLTSIKRQTTELSFVEMLDNSTEVVLREPLLESATY